MLFRSVRIDFFLDHSGDNNASNGTAVTYDFRIVNSLNSTDVLYEVLANGSEWVSEGVAELSLEPGAYRIDIESSDADAGDPFGTRIMTGYTGFVVGLRGNSVERSIGFDPEWRINITFSNESGGPLADRKSTRLNSSHALISYAVFCLKKKNNTNTTNKKKKTKNNKQI